MEYVTIDDLLDAWAGKVVKEKYRKDQMYYTQETNKFWMVTGPGNSPKVRQSSFEAAKKEAQRLAAQHPTEKFYVLEATHESCVTGVTTKALY